MSDAPEQNFWRKCSSCKASVNFGSPYYTCSVSTCNGQRTGYIFCSVPCFERHLPGARHRDAAAIEMMAPSPHRPPQRTIVATRDADRSPQRGSSPQEILVIASRLKDYIQARSSFNTSSSVMERLSDHLRMVCDRAIDNARADGRKTVMDRDFNFLKTDRL